MAYTYIGSKNSNNLTYGFKFLEDRSLRQKRHLNCLSTLSISLCSLPSSSSQTSNLCRTSATRAKMQKCHSDNKWPSHFQSLLGAPNIKAFRHFFVAKVGLKLSQKW